jgi:hypothetical protein
VTSFPARRTAREAAAEVGFPLFAPAGDGFERSVAGWGGGGDERRVGLRHRRDGAEVEVETVVGRAESPVDHPFWGHRAIMKWGMARRPIPIPFTVEMRTEEIEVDVDGRPTTFVFLGDDEVWVVSARIGERVADVTGVGFPLGELALVSLTSLDGYRFPDEAVADG